MNIDSDLYNACLYAEYLEERGEKTGIANWKAGNRYCYTTRSVYQARAYLKKLEKEGRRYEYSKEY